MNLDLHFKRPELEVQFELELEPEARRLLEDFARASPRFGLPAPVLTCLGRTAEENRACGGVPTSLHLWEVDALGNRATRAADLSLRPYEGTQIGLAHTWLVQETRRRGGKARWELLLHSVKGAKPDHFHIGRKRVP